MGEIKLDQISKRFGHYKAVDRVSLTIKEGEFFTFLGPSGCGKTTLLRMIAGFEIPTSGRIFIDQEDITTLPPHKRQVNTIFQNYSLFPHLKVSENIAFGLKIKKVPAREIKERVVEMLNSVHMLSHADKYPDQISGGEKQRVAIARALINKPQVLLLDEPLSALDLKLRQKMLIELINIHEQAGITFIYVTHDQGEAMSISDRMAVMNGGEIIQIGPPVDLWERPNSLFSAYFVGDTNLFSGKVIAIKEGRVTTLCQVNGYTFEIVTASDLTLPIGQQVTLSLRPEKIALSRIKPSDQGDINVLKGKIEDILYLGTHTQYILRIGSMEVKVFTLHKRVHFEEDTFQWNDLAYLFWHDTDSFIINELPETTFLGHEPTKFRKKTDC